MRGRHLLLNCLWLKILAFLFPVFLSSQTPCKVINDEGQPLIGVYVSYKKTTVTTDSEGVFKVPEGLGLNTTFQFQYLSFQEKKLRLADIIKNSYQVVLQQDVAMLDEIVIIGRNELEPRFAINQLEQVKAAEINSSGAQNPAEALELNAGVYVQRSQMGGGSPVLRGFEANKVLLVIDGVRMNNAIYRNGHLQNAITVDPAAIDEMQVLFGGASLLYGSDALGGVIHFKTKEAEFNYDSTLKSRQRLNSYIRYNSANHEKRIHANYAFGKRKWSVFTGFSYVDFDDLRAGSQRRNAYPDFGKRLEYIETTQAGEDLIIQNDNFNIQRGTAYSQWDFLQKWKFQLTDHLQYNLNIQYSSSSDIPRYDNLIARRNDQLRYAEWYYGPQNRALMSHSFTYKRSSLLFDEAKWIFSFQSIDEDRIIRRRNAMQREYQEEDVQVYGWTADYKKFLRNGHQIIYGWDVHFNEVKSNAYQLNDVFSETPVRSNDILSRYPNGGSSMLNIGAYFQHIYESRDSSLVWVNGLRYSYQNLSFEYERNEAFEWPAYFYDGINSHNDALVGISGLNIKRGVLRLKINSGTSFRAPNLDDTAKIRVNNDEITIPNPELKAERIWNNEISIFFEDQDINLGATFYHTQAYDAITRVFSSLPNGSTFFIAQGDTLAVTSNDNVQRANIQGLSLSVDSKLSDSWHFSGQWNMQIGKIIERNEAHQPLGHIPPTFANATLRYTTNLWNLQLNCRYNAWKRIDDYGGSVDNPELATPDGTPAFLVLGLNAEYQHNNNWSLNAGVNNIFDTHYRAFASGVSGPGRHIFISLNYHWSN